MDFEKLSTRMAQADNEKLRWLAQYEDLYRYILPNRDALNVGFDFDDRGKPCSDYIYDNTAMLSANKRANDLHGLLIPEGRRWAKLSAHPYNTTPSQRDQMQSILDFVNDRTQWYLSQSNLARVVSGSFLDLTGGTMALWMDSPSDDNPIRFQSVPSFALSMEYTHSDLVETGWFKIKMTARQVLEVWPKYNGEQREALNSNPDTIVVVRYGQVLLANGKYYVYGVLDSDPLTPLFGQEQSFKQLIIARDRVRPGEVEGRGIGVDMLPTIRDLNKVVEQHRKSLDYKANPPMFYDNLKYFNPHMINGFSGALIPRRANERNPLEAMQMPESPDVFNTIQELQNIIKEGFQVDPMGEVNSPVKSATEVQIRENRAQRSEATDLARLINELPKQIYLTAIQVLSNRNKFTDSSLINPKTNKPMSGKVNPFDPIFRFEYESPLYDLQKEADLNNFVQALQIQQQFFGEGAAIASVKVENVPAFLVDKLNLQSSLFKSGQELMGVVKVMGQQAQQAQLPQSQTTAQQLPQLPGQANPGVQV